MSSSSRQRILFAILIMLSALLPLAQPAYANSYVVTSFADSGAGTLRQAIIDANNSAGADTITFSNPGTITLSTPLPALTGGNITIDGTVPAGGTTPRIEVRGNGNTAGPGILIKSSGNTIRGLIINGFNFAPTQLKGAGIVITSYDVSGANNNTIEHSYIGTNSAGSDFGFDSLPFNNFNGGVLLLEGASSNIVQNNVISGNYGPGVFIGQDGITLGSKIQSGNIIRNNIIGLNATGNAEIRNDSAGVSISNNSNNNIIGPNNTISANGRDSAFPPYGIEINGKVSSGGYIQGNVVQENRIGTNLSGTSSIPNRGGGVLISSSENTVVGGSNSSDKNIISGGNDKAGVAVAEANDTPTGEIRVINAKIQNNWIGLGSTGAAFNTGGQGVLLHLRAAGVLVTENVISGNRDGVQIIGRINETDPARHPRNNTVSDNLIGTTTDGNGIRPNSRHGIVVRGAASGNVITGNRIAGNGSSGVTLEDDSIYGTSTPQATRNNTISNNEIINNGPTGVQILAGSFNNTIGPGNTVRNHGVSNTGAVLLQGTNTRSNTIKGNTITNNQIGVYLTARATNNTIGGSGNGDGNQISNNASHGVLISGIETDGNTVQNNRVENNAANGILVNNGAVENRITGTTTDSNTGRGIALAAGGNRQGDSNLPGLSGISVTGTNLSATASNCSGGCTVEIFTDDTPLSDEGPTFLTRATNVNGSFSLSIAGCKPHLIFTIADSSGNTSEFRNPQGPFSQCLPVEPGVALTAANPSTKTVEPGQSATYNHRVTNTGTASGTFNVSISSTQGWATDDFPDADVVLAPNQFRDFTVTVTVPPSAQVPSEDRTTVTASVGSETAQRTDTTVVAQVGGVAFAPDREQTTPIDLPGSATYTHVLTNTGNGQDVFDLIGSVDTGGVTGVTFNFDPPSPITLNPGQAQTIEVTVNFPTSVSVPLVVTRVEAQSRADGDVSDDVTQTTTIELAPIPRLTPDGQSQSGDPGTSVTYIHTLQNIGSESGDFRLDVNLADWNYTIVPNEGDAIPLDPGQTTPVTLTVDIPAAVLVGDSREATVTASVDGNSVTDDAKDLTTALLVPSLTFVADEARNAGPGETITYVHTLTNTGNGIDTFTVTASPPNGWQASILPVGEITLERNASQPVTLTLTVPQGIAQGLYDTIVTAQSTSDVAVEESVTDTTTVVPAAVPRFDAPQMQATDPEVTVDFEHTLTNVGNIDGAFDLTVEGLPVGWTSSFTPAASVNINEGDNAQVTVLITPPDGTLAGNYDFVVRATAQGGTNATATVVDTVEVNRKAALALVSDEANTEPPNTVVTTTHTLTNNGNFTDTINVATSASEGWGVRPIPPILDIPAGASEKIEVELTIPPGQVKDLVNTTLVTATSAFSPSVQASVQITTTIAEAPGVLWIEPVLSRAGEAGTPVTFTFELLNSGSISQTYAMEITDVPDDWTATLIPTTTALLEPGQILSVQLVVQVPEETPLGTIGEVQLLATSEQADVSDPRGRAAATAIMTVGPQFGVVITPDNQGSALPGELVSYTHTVTNTGFTTDTIILDVRSSLGWQADVSPVSVFLEPGETAPVTVTVLVPLFVNAGTVDLTIVSARSASDPRAPSGEAVDTTTALQYAGVDISSGRAVLLEPGKLVSFDHQVLNIGNGRDTFVISVTQTLDWDLTLTPTTTPRLSRNIRFPVEVDVQIPADVDPVSINEITVMATSEFDPAISSRLVNIIAPLTVQQEPPRAQDYTIHLPIIRR